MRKAILFCLFITMILLNTLMADPVGKALVGGQLIDGYGAKPIADSVVLIEGERVVAVGRRGGVDIPEGYQRISMEGRTILPGLWEMHAHLMLVGHTDYEHWDREYPHRLADEIMPAAAEQLLLAGVTTARDLGASLEDSISVKERLKSGELAGPRLFVSGPFIQPEPYPGTERFRWGVDSPADARRKVSRLAKAGVDVIKLVDQDLMSLEEARAVVDTAHAHGLPVVAHAHRPDEIRLGLELGVDNFEHTGLALAPEYPDDIIRQLRERTATGRVHGGPLYWTPTVEGIWNYASLRDDPEAFMHPDCWKRGLKADTIADIEASIQHPDRLDYYQLHPLRQRTVKRKVSQLRESGVILLVGTDSGIPLKFHCESTWNEMAFFVEVMDIPIMETIQAASYWPARMMGVLDQWGTIAPGQYADIIAVDGDLMDNIRLLQDVEWVMKGGIVYKRDGEPVEARFPAR